MCSLEEGSSSVLKTMKIEKYGNKENLIEFPICGISIIFNSVGFYTHKSLPQYYSMATWKKNS